MGLTPGENYSSSLGDVAWRREGKGRRNPGVLRELEGVAGEGLRRGICQKAEFVGMIIQLLCCCGV